MIEKRQKATKVKCNGMNLLKNSQDSWNIFFFRRNFEVRSQKNTKLYHNRPGEKQNFQLELHDHQICYVSIDLPHQYRISVTEAQTSLGARSEETRLYSLANNLQKKKRSKADFTVGNNSFLLPIFQKARSSFFRVLHTMIR